MEKKSESTNTDDHYQRTSAYEALHSGRLDKKVGFVDSDAFNVHVLTQNMIPLNASTSQCFRDRKQRPQSLRL